MNKCEYRRGLTKASIVFPYWTNITYSEDPEIWKKDLEEHRRDHLEGDDWITFFDLNVNEIYGGFGLDINSLEELEDISKFFFSRGFSHQMIRIYESSYLYRNRCWYSLGEDFSPFPQETTCSLFLYPLEWKDYPKLREVLLDLWRIGYLVYYKNNKFY